MTETETAIFNLGTRIDASDSFAEIRDYCNDVIAMVETGEATIGQLREWLGDRAWIMVYATWFESRKER